MADTYTYYECKYYDGGVILFKVCADWQGKVEEQFKNTEETGTINNGIAFPNFPSHQKQSERFNMTPPSTAQDGQAAL